MYEKSRTVVVTKILLDAVGVRLIVFKRIISRMELFPLFDGLWQFNWTPTSSLLCTTHWICAQHRSKSTCTNIQSETVDITTLQNDKVVLKLYITVSYLSGRGNYSYTSGCWFGSSRAHHRQGGFVFVIGWFVAIQSDTNLITFLVHNTLNLCPAQE